MGVYLPDMEMPKPGEVIRIYNNGEARRCHVTEQEAFEVGTAFPVPAHGRLIDADKMRESIRRQAGLLKLVGGKISDVAETLEKGFLQEIANAPTIIPTSDESVKTEEDTEPWLCLSCRHYPPSSTDGKPCSQCNPREVWHSCYDPAEEGE